MHNVQTIRGEPVHMLLKSTILSIALQLWASGLVGEGTRLVT